MWFTKYSIGKVENLLKCYVEVNIVSWSDSLDCLCWVKFDLMERPSMFKTELMWLEN